MKKIDVEFLVHRIADKSLKAMKVANDLEQRPKSKNVIAMTADMTPGPRG